MKWIKHYSGANMDAKLAKLRLEFGAEGYGIYWICLELIAVNVCPKNIGFNLEHSPEIIAHMFKMDSGKVSQVIDFIVDLGLFECKEGVISCPKMAEILDDTNSKNPEIKKVIANLNAKESQNKSENISESRRKSEKVLTEENRLEENRLDNNNLKSSDVVDAYNEILFECRKVKKLSGNRLKHLRARIKNDLKTIEQWRNYFSFVKSCSWLMRHENRDWMDFDWLINEQNMTKVYEGKYNNDRSKKE